MQKRDKINEVLYIAKKELKKEKRESIIVFILLFITLFTISFLLVFLATKFLITGYVSYIQTEGGYITELNLTQKFPTDYWAGLYGLAIRVPGFTDLQFQDAHEGLIERMDLFFDCIQGDALGGNEIYASTSPVIDWDNLQPATAQMVNDWVGCNGKTECPTNTFLETTSIMLGNRNISGIPITHTYRYDGENEIFDIGILNDSANLVFVTHIQAIQKGYRVDRTVNFQMLLPIPPNSSLTYYYFTDPNDVCPPGGLGNNLNATISGYVFDNKISTPLANASVFIAGYPYLTDSNGFYNITFTVIPGTYNIIASKDGYVPAFDNVTVTFSNFTFVRNFTLYTYPKTNETNISLHPRVYGYIFDNSGNILSDVFVYLAGTSNLSDSNGHYSLSPIIFEGTYPILAIKANYNNYYYFLNFTSNTSEINHNITLIPSAINYPFPTGPYPVGPFPTGPYSQTFQQQIIQARKNGDDYWVSTKEIRREVRQNTFVEERIGLFNLKSSVINLLFSVSSNIQDFVRISKPSISVNPNSFSELIVTIYGTRPLGIYNGTITISGDINQVIPVIITVVERRSLVEALLMDIDVFNRIVRPGDKIKYRLNLQNLLREQGYKIFLRISLTQKNNTEIYAYDEDEVEIINSLTLLKELNIPSNVTDGDYLLNVEADYLNLVSTVAAPVTISKPIYLYSVFGIPLWIYFVIISFFSFILLNFLIYKHMKERKKRYKIYLDYNTLPKPGPGIVRLGNVAETGIHAYYELERLTTHAIVAGATGMGKSISAQVIVEEALMNNIAVIVMDPTAQWSGMLRKCQDKKMMSFYPKFGLKETDARAFKGNVRQITDARQLININKYIAPGQIQIFSLNKLDPKDIDFFVANFIRQIFRSDPKESPNLKVLLVFDEVHRLLSKFGGSGQGFLQVERSCREFRKWGIGVMLISQVLSDFVGEIKANINTEVQARTLEESDLERIRTKYGEEYLKSLVRAEVGVAMFQNAEYNRGRPYFINFRPILHNTRRLPDEELEKYNKYNDLVDDLEFQIEQLEKEKIDVFDLKMELKLVKDKIMTGNFSVVEIYLEGLVPRIAKEWEKLGKQPKKREIELVNEEEIRKSIDEAKKAREKYEKEEAKKAATEAAVKLKEEVKENVGAKEAEKKTEETSKKVEIVAPVKTEELAKKPTETKPVDNKNVSKEVSKEITKDIPKDIKKETIAAAGEKKEESIKKEDIKKEDKK